MTTGQTQPNTNKMDQLREDIKIVGEKIDNHFKTFNQSFNDHEKMEMKLLQLSEKRLDKVEEALKLMRSDYDEKHEKIDKKIKYITVFLAISYLLIVFSVAYQVFSALK